MVSRTPWLRLGAILLLAHLLSAPAAVESQCAAVSMQMTSTFPTFPSFIIITKTFNMTAMCVTTTSNAFGCGRSPTATMATMLIATAYTGMTVAPFCQWSCTCGPGRSATVRTDGSDGLPVELMEFEIEEIDEAK